MEKIYKIVDFLEKHDLYPDLRIIQGSATPEVIIDGKKVLMFASNNYLSLATHPRVVEAALKALKEYGAGSGGSRLLSGNLEVHRLLENKLVEFKCGKKEKEIDAIVWPSGYSANVGIIPAVMKILEIPGISFFQREGIVFSDQLNHASIIDGCRMSKAKVVVFKHNDMDDLERKIKKFKRRRKMIVVDGVFSMDGDIAPMNKIVALAKKYNAITMIDEAHSTGVLGKKGRGVLEYFGLKPVEDVDVLMGTLSKAVGVAGGFVVGHEKLINYLRIASRSYMFSTAMTPATAASINAAFDVMISEPVWAERLKENAEYLKDKFRSAGFDTLGSQTQIIPILIGKDEDAVEFSRMLFNDGIFGPCVRWPAVEKGKARIRFTVMSAHTKEQIDFLVDSCKKIAKSLKKI